MAKFVKRITIVSSDGGTRTPIYKSKKKKRKVSRWLKDREKTDRKMVQAVSAFGDELLKRHNRSNRKRRNGWLKDGPLNLMRAHRKAAKKLRKF